MREEQLTSHIFLLSKLQIPPATMNFTTVDYKRSNLEKKKLKLYSLALLLSVL